MLEAFLELRNSGKPHFYGGSLMSYKTCPMYFKINMVQISEIVQFFKMRIPYTHRISNRYIFHNNDNLAMAIM